MSPTWACGLPAFLLLGLSALDSVEAFASAPGKMRHSHLLHRKSRNCEWKKVDGGQWSVGSAKPHAVSFIHFFLFCLPPFIFLLSSKFSRQPSV